MKRKQVLSDSVALEKIMPSKFRKNIQTHLIARAGEIVKQASK